MKLSNATMDALNFRLSVCEEEPDLQEVVPELERVIGEGTVEALRDCSAAQQEIELEMDASSGKELSAMVRDMCLAGFFPVYEPDSICSRTIKRRTFNGITYNCGY